LKAVLRTRIERRALGSILGRSSGAAGDQRNERSG